MVKCVWRMNFHSGWGSPLPSPQPPTPRRGVSGWLVPCKKKLIIPLFAAEPGWCSRTSNSHHSNPTYLLSDCCRPMWKQAPNNVALCCWCDFMSFEPVPVKMMPTPSANEATMKCCRHRKWALLLTKFQCPHIHQWRLFFAKKPNVFCPVSRYGIAELFQHQGCQHGMAATRVCFYPPTSEDGQTEGKSHQAT